MLRRHFIFVMFLYVHLLTNGLCIAAEPVPSDQEQQQGQHHVSTATPVSSSHE